MIQIHILHPHIYYTYIHPLSPPPPPPPTWYPASPASVKITNSWAKSWEGKEEPKAHTTNPNTVYITAFFAYSSLGSEGALLGGGGGKACVYIIGLVIIIIILNLFLFYL